MRRPRPVGRVSERRQAAVPRAQNRTPSWRAWRTCPAAVRSTVDPPSLAQPPGAHNQISGARCRFTVEIHFVAPRVPSAASRSPSATGEVSSGSSALHATVDAPVTADLLAPPLIRIAVARDRTPEARATGGFLDLRRLDLVAHYPDGTSSLPFSYDVGARVALDAVVIAAYFTSGGERHVYLRSAIRPPCALRPIPPWHDGDLWELPAGLVEPTEDPAETAARELGEELGFSVDASALTPLGPWTFPAPGMIGERHLFFAVEVDPRSRGTPTEDGSALERAAAIVTLPISTVLHHCRAGNIPDAKTELGVRRLAELP